MLEDLRKVSKCSNCTMWQVIIALRNLFEYDMCLHYLVCVLMIHTKHEILVRSFPDFTLDSIFGSFGNSIYPHLTRKFSTEIRLNLFLSI
jgi:hypothetical protein